MYTDNSRLIKAIKKAIDIFDAEYQGKNFLIIYKDEHKKLNYKKLVFQKRHFLHLTGVIYHDKPKKVLYKNSKGQFFYLDNQGKKILANLNGNKKPRKGNRGSYYIQGNADAFYKQCVNNTLDLKLIEEKENGTTYQKLEVFPQLLILMKGSSLVGYFNGNGYELVADYFLGNSRKTAAIGFKSENNFDIPKTLLSKDVKEITQDPCSVVAIYSKKISDKKYTETYQSKNISLNIKKLPPEIKDLITKDNP